LTCRPPERLHGETGRNPPGAYQDDDPPAPGDPPFPLGSLGLQIKHHWKKYRPRMYRELEKSGHLEESLSLAENLTSDSLFY
jgi:hypothetical protein